MHSARFVGDIICLLSALDIGIYALCICVFCLCVFNASRTGEQSVKCLHRDSYVLSMTSLRKQ